MPTAVCSSCSKAYRVPAEAVGKRFKCKACGGVIAVPATAASTKQLTTTAEPKKPAVPPPLPAAPSYEDPDGGNADLDALASLETTGVVDNSIPLIAVQSTLNTTRSSGTSSTVKSKPARSMPRFKFGLNLSPLPIIVIFIGICVAVWGGKEALLASGAAEKPQDIVCADLAANGPGNNTHVRVTNFYSVGNFVYRKSPNGDWQTAWFAIVPPSAAKVPRGKRVLGHVVSPDIVDPSQIKVLIKSRTVRSQEQLESVMNRDSIEGLVINRIEKLTDLERQQLQDAFPAANMDQVCIVEDGRQPAGGSGLLALVGGGLLILGGLILIFRPVS